MAAALLTLRDIHLTFGGTPLACAVALAVLSLIITGVVATAVAGVSAAATRP